jgi:hypothetical protein
LGKGYRRASEVSQMDSGRFYRPFDSAGFEVEILPAKSSESAAKSSDSKEEE